MQIYTQQQLLELSASALVQHYNALAGLLGERLVNRFSNHTTAVKRVSGLQDRYFGTEAEADGAEIPPPAEDAPEAEEPAPPKAKKQREKKRRGPYFVFKPTDALREPQPGSRRRTAFDLLRRPEGATQAEIEVACGWNDRQAYEAIRLMHYMHGYGLRFVDQAAGRVQVYTKDEEHPVARS